MATIGTEVIDGETMLVKSEITKDVESTCVTDFCGYSSPGHYPVSFWADYFPSLGFTRFGGDWWNAPDMESSSEPTEEEVTVWARKHGVGI
jgi:hypothetical protein